MLIYYLHASGQLDKPNLMLMDSHYVHVFNYCFMQMMYCQDIKVFALEPHTSHWGQPLDKNSFFAFKDAFNEGMHKFNRLIGGRSMQKSEFFSVFNVAWEKPMTSKNIKAWYKRTGIWPVNRAAIPSYIIEPGKICKSKVVLNCIVFYCISLDWIVFSFSLTTIKMIWYMCSPSVIQFFSSCLIIFLEYYRLCRR